MNRKRDEALLLQQQQQQALLSHNPDDLSASFDRNSSYSMTGGTKRMLTTDPASSTLNDLIIDQSEDRSVSGIAPSMVGPATNSQVSNLTSNVDSVYSFYNQGQNGDEENSEENNHDQGPTRGGRKAGGGMLDLKEIMMDVNASVLSKGTTTEIKNQRKKEQRLHKEQAIQGTKRQPIEVFTFVQNSRGGKVKCRLSRKSTVFQNPYAKKYDMDIMVADSGLTTPMDVSTCGDNQIDNETSCQVVEEQNVQGFCVPAQVLQQRLKNFSGIYISPDSGKPSQNKYSNKRKLTGDLRFKVRDLQHFSNLSGEDFFLQGRNQTESSQISKQAATEESIEDQISQADLENMKKNPLINQYKQILAKRQKLGALTDSKKFEMREPNKASVFVPHNIYFDEIFLPMLNKDQIMNKEQQRGHRLSKLSTSYLGQFRQYLSASDIKDESQSNNNTTLNKNPIQIQIIAIEKRYSKCCIIGKQIQNSESQEATKDSEYFKILFNPLFSQKCKLNLGDSLRITQYYDFDISSLWDEDHQIKQIKKALIVHEFLITQSLFKDTPLLKQQPSLQCKDTEDEEEDLDMEDALLENNGEAMNDDD